MNEFKRRCFLGLLTAVLLDFSGCYTFVDTSKKGLQQMWLEWVRDGAIGANIFECRRRNIRPQPCAVFYGSTTPISSKKLSNGNTEDEYEWHPVVGRCRYFYEYETTTGRILGFRFEETVQYGCRITGA